jgi:hypothetical protein
MRHAPVLLATASMCLSLPLLAQTGGKPAPEPAQKIAPLQPSLARVFGGAQDDVLSSMLVDASGAAYFVGETKSFHDKTYNDLLVAKVNPDGALAWARTYGTPDDDRPRSYIDGKHGGSSRTAALGPDGSVYVVMGSMVTGRREPWAAVVFKVSPAGELAWSRVWRPAWENMAKNQAFASTIAVAGGRVWVGGMTGAGQVTEEGMAFLAGFDAATGDQKSIVAFDPAPGSNDRVFAAHADATSVVLAGWNGKTNRGQLTRFAVDGEVPNLEWSKSVPFAQTGSGACDLDRDGAGNIYLAGDIHGSGNYVQVLKLGPDGAFKWGRRYNPGASNDKNNTRAVRVLGDKLVVAGRVGLMGTQTHADRTFGDSLLLTYDLEGKLLSEHYHFTGTANDVVAMDGATSIGAVGRKLYVGGYLWPYTKNHVGEWRDPNGYAVNHPAASDSPGDFLLEDTKPAVVDLSKIAAKKGSELGALGWKDVTPAMNIGTPKEQTALEHGQQTQFYLFTFDGLL